MIIKDLFKKPIDRNIQGVVVIGGESEEQKIQELEEYVCTDEITSAFRTFFKKYRESLNTPTEKMGVWITGFFGSGKSHFLKILGYILENEMVGGKFSSDYFDEKIDNAMILADIKECSKAKNKVVLFNIDSKAKSDSKNKTQAIMDIMLRAFNESVGYCGIRPWVADMERMLDHDNLLDIFKEKFKNLSGSNWEDKRNIPLISKDIIIKVLSEVKNISVESATQYFDDQVNNYTNTTEDFAKIVNDYCEENETRVVFLMDEVGQFIDSENSDLMLNLQTCVEDLGKYCKGKAWVVVTSQQELKAMLESTKSKQNDFSKIQGRFDTRLLLSGSNADEVIKKRILDKKDIAITPLKSLYDSNSNKLSQLILFPQKPSWSGYKDADDFANVYPFVSYQFELLQKVFEAIREHGMSEGKHLSQNERSLLSAFQVSAIKFGNNNEGILIPFDSFYQTVEEFIDYDIKTVFSNAERRGSIDEFSLRVLRILFMIKYVKEMPGTLDRITTLMISSITEDKAELKNRIINSLKILEDETLIQKDGDEYSFLTNEEQDINKQINNSNYNEGEVKRNILDILYDKVLDNNKFKYENRYEFPLNRYVDDESKGTFNPNNMTIKVFTQYSSISDETSFAAESRRNNSIIVDLTNGNYIDELIRANKIATYKMNNSVSMSSSKAEIMSKKTAEYSERMKRAEDIIRNSLRTANIYFNGNILEIKEKDGRDRLNEALKIMVSQQYYKLNFVTYFYDRNEKISEVLDEDRGMFNDIENDANYNAYQEIIDFLKNNRDLRKRTTVKDILDYFGKMPFGWRDSEIIGSIAVLWKSKIIQILIHENVVEDNNRSFKNDLVRKANIDMMVIRLQERISDEILYKVKRIMNDIYSENYNMDEDSLSTGVYTFFNDKKNLLEEIKNRNGMSYPGSKLLPEVFRLFEDITKSSDALTIFNKIIEHEDELRNTADFLEQVETFYKSGSNQYQNYKEANLLFDWYQKNCIIEDLSEVEETMNKISDIITMELPFSRMAELSDLVFNAKDIKTKMLNEKLSRIRKMLENAQEESVNETNAALKLDLSEEQKNKIVVESEKIKEMYTNWLSSINENTPNLDAYIVSSNDQLEKYKALLQGIINEQKVEEQKSLKVKKVTIINCIPIAKKTIKNVNDIEEVLGEIRKKLVEELEDNDEINLN